jgi:hypothetical protein
MPLLFDSVMWKKLSECVNMAENTAKKKLK